MLKAILQEQGKVDPEECGSKDTTLFDPAVDDRSLRGVAVELNCPFISVWKDTVSQF